MLGKMGFWASAAKMRELASHPDRLTTNCAKFEVRMVRYSFPVRLFHSPLHTGLSRRSGCPGIPPLCAGVISAIGVAPNYEDFMKRNWCKSSLTPFFAFQSAQFRRSPRPALAQRNYGGKSRLRTAAAIGLSPCVPISSSSGNPVSFLHAGSGPSSPPFAGLFHLMVALPFRDPPHMLHTRIL